MVTEPLRSDAAKRFLSLSLNKEKELQDIVELAAEICEVPTALITILDEDTQHIRFKVGLNVDKTNRDVSFCTYAIHHDKVFEVEDSHHDPRFEKNPMVTGYPYIRSYTGAPLTTTDGRKLGTLCVIGNEPKQLTEKQKHVLELLSRQVMSLLELEWNLKVFREELNELEAENIQLRASLGGFKN